MMQNECKYQGCEDLRVLTQQVAELRHQLTVLESNQVTSNKMLNAICDRFAIDVSLDASRRGVRFRGSPVVAVVVFASTALTMLAWKFTSILSAFRR